MPARVIARTASGNADGAIQLDQVGASLLDQRDRGADGGVGPFLQRTEREIAAHQRAAPAPRRTARQASII